MGSPINPDHYKADGVECIDVLRAVMTEEEFRGYCRGNAVKYLYRLYRKGDAAENVAKAEVYLHWLKESLL